MLNLFTDNNRLFDLARSGEWVPPWWVALPMAIVIIFVAQIFGLFTAIPIILALSLEGVENMGRIFSGDINDEQIIRSLATPNTALEQIIFLVLLFGPIFILLWIWLRLFEKRSLVSTGMEWQGALFKYGRGLVVGIAMFVASILLMLPFGYISLEAATPGSTPQGFATLGVVLLVYLGWTVQGPAEEVLTRGWLLPVIGVRYHPTIGIMVSSLLFAVLHLLNPNVGAIPMLNLFLFGVFAALYALYEESLWGIFSIHAVWNWVQGNGFGFEVSGQPVPGGILLNLQEVGPDLITGGPFGPEGGLAVTAVLLASSAIVIWLSSQKPAPQPAITMPRRYETGDLEQ